MKVPLALVGAELPGGLKIKKSKIRGETSEGMLCSARELEMGGDHSGILALSPDAPVGRPVREVLRRARRPVRAGRSVQPSRPSVRLGHGARAVRRLRRAARGGPAPRFDARVQAGGTFKVTVEDPQGCARYLAQVVRGITIAPSPAWLSERLERAGMRPINNVVDVTNYVMLEMGQPLHAFDLDTLEGPAIVVRRAHAGEPLTTLDGRERKLTPEHLVIADARRATGLAGTMGAEFVEVTAKTTNLLLEAAWFDPVRVQRMVSDHGLMSEAARRFGRGVDPALAPAAMARALALFTELAGGRLDGAATEVSARPFTPLELELRPARAMRLLGARIARDRMAKDLEAAGFGVTDTGGGGDETPLVVTVPTRRRDVTGETDLIEEVGRSFGYDRLPDVPLTTGGSVGTRSDERRLRDRRARGADRPRLHRVPDRLARRSNTPGEDLAARAHRRAAARHRAQSGGARDVGIAIGPRVGARARRRPQPAARRGRAAPVRGRQGVPCAPGERATGRAVRGVRAGRRLALRRGLGRRAGGDRFLRGERSVGGVPRASRR
jgi:phenylalanyl-tRNA synthetase beta chain